MAVELKRRLLTVEEYHQMGEMGILKEKGLELIHGEILEMSPIGSRHAAVVEKLKDLLVLSLQGKAQVRIQNPIVLDKLSEPEPDIALVKYRSDYYAEAHPTAEDTLLIIEVALSSLAYDREIKVPLYAAAGIPELWIMALDTNIVEVYRKPGKTGYAQQEVLGTDEKVFLPVADIQLEVGDIFG